MLTALHLISIAVCLIFLSEPVLSLIARMRRKSKQTGLRIRRFPDSAAPIFKTIMRILVGASLAWGLCALELQPGLLIVVLLPVHLLCERAAPRTAECGATCEIAFYETLDAQISEGADFFASLAAAGTHLRDKAALRAVSIALERFSERRELAHCLAPLTKINPFFAGLGADVLRTGWKPSSALRLSVRQMLGRVSKDWQDKHRLRKFSGHLEALRPVILKTGWGMAAFIILSNGGPPNQFGHWVLISSLAVLLRSLVTVRRTLFLAWGASLIILVIWYAIPAGTATSTARVRVAERSKQAFSRSYPRLDGPPDHMSEIISADGSAPEICRVRTGFDPGWAHLRTEPAIPSRPLGYAAEGELLDILAIFAGDSSTGAWIEVRSPAGQTGWIYSSLCEVDVAAP